MPGQSHRAPVRFALGGRIWQRTSVGSWVVRCRSARFGTIPGDWPDDLDGPAEGSLTVDECRALIDLLQPVTNEPVTFFYRWANTEGWTGRCDTGSLTDLLEYFDLEDVSGTPAYWWPEDRSWVVCTDVDSCYTLVGGSEQLISSILRHPEFESHRVNPEDPFP